ncbi:hypothetical protein NECAME_06523, partial [Necator americanus]
LSSFPEKASIGIDTSNCDCSVLPYQYHVRVLELLIILAFAPIEAIRLSWGSRGNLTETPVFLGFSILLSVPLLLILLYLAVFQNYGRSHFKQT